MCVVSMVMDGYDRFPWQPQPPNPWYTTITTTAEPRKPTDEETEDYLRRKEETRTNNEKLAKLFNELLKEAAKYDERTNQPHCEDAEKKAKVQKLADELGITIEFPE